MVWGWDFVYSPSSFLSVIHIIYGIVLGKLLPLVYCLMRTKSKSSYELLFETFKDVAQVRKGNERILRVVQSYGDRTTWTTFVGSDTI